MCLWETCLSLRTSFFFSNHSNDLTQLELRLGCLAFFSVLCACFSVIYIFFLPWGILPVGASCDPDETKVCVFPTNLQRSSKPKTTLPVCVWLAGTLADANSVLVSNQVQYVMWYGHDTGVCMRFKLYWHIVWQWGVFFCMLPCCQPPSWQIKVRRMRDGEMTY